MSFSIDSTRAPLLNAIHTDIGEDKEVALNEKQYAPLNKPTGCLGALREFFVATFPGFFPKTLAARNNALQAIREEIKEAFASTDQVTQRRVLGNFDTAFKSNQAIFKNAVIKFVTSDTDLQAALLKPKPSVTENVVESVATAATAAATATTSAAMDVAHLASSAAKGTRNMLSKVYQAATGASAADAKIEALLAKPAALEKETKEVHAAMTEITQALKSADTASDNHISLTKFNAQTFFEDNLLKLSPLAKKLIKNICAQEDNFITRTLTAIDGKKELGDTLNHSGILAEATTQVGLKAAEVSDVVIKRLVATK